MENSRGSGKTNDEIDLTQFFRWVGNGLRRFGNSMFYSLAVLRNSFFQNLAAFAIIMGLGLAIGILYSTLLQKRYYKSTMVLSCEYLNSQILGNMIEKMNNLSGDPEGTGLAKELGISIDEAKNIQKFEFKTFVSEDDRIEMEILREQLNNVVGDKKDLVENVIGKLEIENKDAYEISVFVYDPDVVKSLETALISYLSNNSYIKGRIEIEKRNLLARKAKLIAESNKIDSLKTIVYENLQSMSKANRGSNNVILNDENLSDPIQLFKEDLSIHNEILVIERLLYLRPDFEVVDGFTAFNKPDSADIKIIIFYSLVISFLTAYVILGLLALDKKLAAYPVKTW